MSGLDRTAIPGNILDRILELERRLDDLEGYAALATVDPSAEGATDDALTVAEHAAIGTASPHHAAVTLGADAGTILGLTGQQITLDPQGANTVLAGPAAGADADPTFRALGVTDLPAHTHTESDIIDLDHTDVSAIHDDVDGEIHAIAAKVTPVDADELVIEDSEDDWAKKRVALSDMPFGSGGGANLLFSQVADLTVEDSADETSLLGSGRGARAIEAGELAQGSVVILTGHGYLSTTGTPELTIKVKLGGSEVCGTGAVTLNDTVSGVGFTFRVEIVCRATGASGSVVAGGTFEYDDDSEHKLVKSSATAVDTTAALAVDMTVTWGAGSASNTITCQIVTIELVKADDLAVAAPSGLTAVEV